MRLELRTICLVASPAHTKAFATIRNMSPVEAAIKETLIDSKNNVKHVNSIPRGNRYIGGGYDRTSRYY